VDTANHFLPNFTIFHLLQKVAAEKNWPLSVATDEALYTGESKKLGRVRYCRFATDFDYSWS
jgi:hypothetical protein